MISNERFDELIDEAIALIPERLRGAIENVLVVAADRPTQEQLQAVGLPSGRHLYGLYRGVPKPARSVFADVSPPDQITIYRESLVRDFGHDETELIDQIHITVLHEIGHHFGLSDEEMKHLEADARERSQRRGPLRRQDDKPPH